MLRDGAEFYLRPLFRPSVRRSGGGEQPTRSDRVCLSAEAGLGITAEREIVAIGADRTCRVTEESGEAALLAAVSDIVRVLSNPDEPPTKSGQGRRGIAGFLVQTSCHEVAIGEERGLCSSNSGPNGFARTESS